MRIRVIVQTAPVDAPVETAPREKEINYLNPSDRKWLNQHCWWAMYNGHVVVTIPNLDDVRIYNEQRNQKLESQAA